MPRVVFLSVRLSIISQREVRIFSEWSISASRFGVAEFVNFYPATESRRSHICNDFGDRPTWSHLKRYSPGAIKGFLRQSRYFLLGVVFFVDTLSSLPSRLRKNVHKRLSTCRVISPSFFLCYSPPSNSCLLASPTSGGLFSSSFALT